LLQVLQRLTNLCALLESMGNETSGRRLATDFLKDVFTEAVIEALVKAFACTLPPARQLFAQLAMRPATALTHVGYSPAARALTSVIKLVASVQPALLLPVLFRAIDDTLGLISASKTALRAFAVRDSPTTPMSPPGKGKSSGKKAAGGSSSSSSSRDVAADSALSMLSPVGKGRGGGGDSDQEDEEDWESVNSGLSGALPPPRRRSRSRGSSFGQAGANVMMVGVLDHIPHRCAFDADFLESPTFASATEWETHIWRFQCATLTLEWLTFMLATGLKSMQRGQGQNLIAAGKDVFRRMFAYMRSSMLEVCRFSSSKWAAKVNNTSTYPRLPPGSRFPHFFNVRVPCPPPFARTAAVAGKPCQHEPAAVLRRVRLDGGQHAHLARAPAIRAPDRALPRSPHTRGLRVRGVPRGALSPAALFCPPQCVFYT